MKGIQKDLADATTQATASTRSGDDHCFISKQTKAKALIKSTDAQSLTDIAKDCFVSPTTVQRVINSEAKQFQKQYQTLPKHISFDEFKTSNSEDMKKYRRLKRYWKLILKNAEELSHIEYKYYHMFGQRLEVNVVDELLSYDGAFKMNYELYQTLLKSVKNKDFNISSETLMDMKSHELSSYMKTSVKTLKKHLSYIQNSLVYRYNNGRIEGINNKIKVLNRVAYGYRNFNNFKNRILLHFKLRSIVNQKDISHSVA